MIPQVGSGSQHLYPSPPTRNPELLIRRRPGGAAGVSVRGAAFACSSSRASHIGLLGSLSLRMGKPNLGSFAGTFLSFVVERDRSRSLASLTAETGVLLGKSQYRGSSLFEQWWASQRVQVRIENLSKSPDGQDKYLGTSSHRKGGRCCSSTRCPD